MALDDLQQQKDIENHKGVWTIITNLQKIGFEMPSSLLRTLTLLSGGALVAILTFVGNLWTRNDELGRQLQRTSAMECSGLGFRLR